MNVNTKLKQALKGLAGGNVWPNSCPLEQDPDEWIVYYPLYEYPADHGDDEDLAWIHYMAVHWVKKGNVNYTQIRKAIRNRLKEAGFSISEIMPFFDKEVDSTHLIFNCSIVEEDFDGTH